MSSTLEARGGEPGKLYGVYLATVVSVKDDSGFGRVQVKLLGFDAVGAQSAPMWARVASPFTGAAAGAFLIPNKDDEVAVQFVQGDPAHPIVIGGLWHGKAKVPEQLGGAGDAVDRWTFVGRNGTRIAIVEEQAGAKISLTTPRKREALTIQEQGGGKIELKTSTATVTLDSSGVTIKTSKVAVTASQVQIDAPMVTVNAAMAKFSGIVKAAVVQATTIIANVYTPGVGNIL
jgi:uncharacterized protein involved in type VI secretion and phage assembly